MLLCLDGDFGATSGGVYNMSNVLSTMISFAVLGLQSVEQDGKDQSLLVHFEDIREICWRSCERLIGGSSVILLNLYTA